jgi:hypothetical protein
MVLCQQNHHAYMYNVVYKRMLSCKHFGIPTFTMHLKILLTKSRSNTRGIT